MFGWFKKEKWALVKTSTVDVKRGKTDGTIYIHLFESDKGNRKIENMSSFPESQQEVIDAFVKSMDIYQTKMFRWLNGRYDPEIPKYSEIPEEDLANALRGKAD